MPLLNMIEIYPERLSLSQLGINTPVYIKIPQNIGSTLLKQAIIFMILVNNRVEKNNSVFFELNMLCVCVCMCISGQSGNWSHWARHKWIVYRHFVTITTLIDLHVPKISLVGVASIRIATWLKYTTAARYL